MTRRATILLGLLCLLVASCGGKPETPAAANEEVVSGDGIRMDAEAQARMGVKVASVAAAKAAQSVGGFARVMDVSTLAAIDSEISSANAAAAASEADYRRLSALAEQDNAASAKSVEAARAQSAADIGRARLAERRVGLEWGPALQKMSRADRSRLLADIAEGKAALLRLDATTSGSLVLHAHVTPAKDGPQVTVEILGPAATADMRLQTSGLLGLVRGDAARTLSTGRLLQAELELGSSEAGFLLPDAALVRTDNSVFVYVRTGPDAFERRDVSEGRATSDGWFIAKEFEASDQIVTEGAASLLAVENGPAEADED